MANLNSRSNKNVWNTLKYGYGVALCCVIIAASGVLLMAQSGKITTKDQRAAAAVTEAIKALGGVRRKS